MENLGGRLTLSRYALALDHEFLDFTPERSALQKAAHRHGVQIDAVGHGVAVVCVEAPRQSGSGRFLREDPHATQVEDLHA